MASRISAAVAAASLFCVEPVWARAPEPADRSEQSAPPSGDTVSIAPLEIEGELDSHLRDELRMQLGEGLARGALAVVEDPAGATFVLHAKVMVNKPDYLLSMDLRRGAEGTVVAAAERTCDLCGAQELKELAADLAATIGRKAGTTIELETKLIVASNPPGAEVTLDGEPIGVTPLEVDVEPGDHAVAVRKEGFIGRTHELSFDEGERESLSVTLEAQGPDRRSRTFRILGWTGVGAGIGGLGAGAALLVIHDQPITSDCAGSKQDGDGDCKFVHKTLPGGIALVAAGALLLGSGVALLVLDRKRTQARRIEALIGPTMVGLRGRF